ncbi:MAG: HNH endonuclease, partial [Candidatus Latescibacterota bacterium]
DRVKPVRVAVTDMGQNAKNRRNSLIFNSRRGSNPANGGDRGRPGSESGRGDWARVRQAPTQQIDAGKPAPTSTDPPPSMPDGSPAPRIEKRLLVQFLATEGFMAKLDEVKALLSNRLPTGTFEEVFEVLISEFLERHSPEKRHRRRERRMAKPATKSPGDTSKPTRGSSSPRPAAPRTRSRHIPAAVRDTVFARDHGRCTYRGKRGNRCGATRYLHVDHIKPFARGGSNALSNLRLLCAKHNRLEAKRVMGPDVINRFTKRG